MAEWGLSSGDRVAWPFYVVCDVSESMHGRQWVRADERTPYEAMQEALLELVDFPDEHVEVADIAHLALLTFADDVKVVRYLSKMSDAPQIGPLPKGTYTNYAQLFSTLSDVAAADLKSLTDLNLIVKRPVVFFITDGQPWVDGREQPRSAWEPPLRRLHGLSAPRPEGREVPIAVVALGFAGANCATLRTVAKWPGVACVAEAGVASPHELMSNMLASILDSVTNSAAEGEFIFNLPPGMSRC